MYSDKCKCERKLLDKQMHKQKQPPFSQLNKYIIYKNTITVQYNKYIIQVHHNCFKIKPPHRMMAMWNCRVNLTAPVDASQKNNVDIHIVL